MFVYRREPPEKCPVSADLYLLALYNVQIARGKEHMYSRGRLRCWRSRPIIPSLKALSLCSASWVDDASRMAKRSRLDKEKVPVAFVRKLVETDEESGLVRRLEYGVKQHGGRRGRGRVCLPRQSRACPRPPLSPPALQTAGQKVAYLECHRGRLAGGGGEGTGLTRGSGLLIGR